MGIQERAISRRFVCSSPVFYASALSHLPRCRMGRRAGIFTFPRKSWPTPCPTTPWWMCGRPKPMPRPISPAPFICPCYTLKPKRFLQGRNVVVVDGGWGSKGSEKEVRRMIEKGFSSLQILYGGLNAWQRRGTPLEGRGASASAVSTLSPPDFRSVQDHSDWLVIDADAARDQTDSDLLSQRIHVPYSPTDEEAFAVEIEALILERYEPVRVLVLNKEGQGYGALRQALAHLSYCPIFYLKDGEKGFVEQMKRMTARNKSKSQRTRRVASISRAGSGRKGSGSKAVRKGCGSCPGGK